MFSAISAAKISSSVLGPHVRVPSQLSCVRFKSTSSDFRKYADFFFTSKFCPRLYDFKFSPNVREQSSKIFKICSKQCEYILAHRIRRSQQIFSLYRRWWGDLRLKFLFQRVNSALWKQKKFAYIAFAAPVFNWEEKRIPDEELTRLHTEEIAKVRKLNEKFPDYFEVFETEKIEPDIEKINSSPCKCDRCLNTATEDDWALFYTSTCLKIWRKEHIKYKDQGLYVYKVYGRFQDVSAMDFFQVQINCEYRKKWDPNSVKLEVVDSDPESCSDVLYWEFLFPKMFYNRDYVCNRRYKIDEKTKTLTIISESTSHPACPERPPIHRVKEYWSHTVIKANTELEKPGLEFTITYFDNPELSIPSYISTWYTMQGMPEYLMEQMSAALDYRAMKNQEKKRKKEMAAAAANNENLPEFKPKKEESSSKPDSTTSFPKNTPEKRVLIL